MDELNRFLITPEFFGHVLVTLLSPALQDQCEAAELRYAVLNEEERERYLLDVVRTLVRDDLIAAGVNRQAEWETGWRENLQALREGRQPEALVPRYHGKHELVRWNQNIVRPLTERFDYKIHCLVVDWAIETWLSQVDTIMEFGCGPAYHLLRARRFNPTARLVGLDWVPTTQLIIKEVVKLGIETNIVGRHFNFYDPDNLVGMTNNTGVLTVAALEQVGDRFEVFLQWLIERRPAVCVHLEPIDELMDEDSLLDQLSVLYCRKRKYLRGFLPRLRELEAHGKVEIIEAKRTYSGSYFLEGHSLVVWKPV